MVTHTPQHLEHERHEANVKHGLAQLDVPKVTRAVQLGAAARAAQQTALRRAQPQIQQAALFGHAVLRGRTRLYCKFGRERAEIFGDTRFLKNPAQRTSFMIDDLISATDMARMRSGLSTPNCTAVILRTSATPSGSTANMVGQAGGGQCAEREPRDAKNVELASEAASTNALETHTRATHGAHECVVNEWG